MSDDAIRLSQVLPALAEDYEIPAGVTHRHIRDLAANAVFPARLRGQVWEADRPVLPMIAKAINAKRKSVVAA
jgi:hypothetical protein